MPIWGDEIRERAERDYRLRLESHTGERLRKLIEDRRVERLLKAQMPPLPPEPGVYEEEIHPPGEHWYKVVMPSGSVGIIHVPDDFWDESLFPNLQRRFEAKSQKRLKIL